MNLRHIVYALGALWLVLFVVAFVVLQTSPAIGDGFARALDRIASFLTWQGAAFVVAMVLALVTRQAALRGIERVKLVGYAPLAASVFLIGSFIAIVAYRVLIVPLFA